MALTDSERDHIVSLRLDGRSIREVMAETGHASATVSKVWHLYLAETAQDRRQDLDLRREELLQRFERNAAEARAGYVTASATADHGAAARYLAAELAALRRVAELEALPERPRFAGGAGTAEDPLPWRTPAEALGMRVAVLERSSRESSALNAFFQDDLVALAAGDLPSVAELAPVAVEALTVED